MPLLDKKFVTAATDVQVPAAEPWDSSEGLAGVAIVEALEYYSVKVDFSRISTKGWIPILCPVHGDREPSAGVNPNLGVFKCHSSACGAGGNVLDLLLGMESIERDAASDLARKLFEQKPSSRKVDVPVAPREGWGPYQAGF
ncbi:MAG: CHC2 zinc finger domain-containing protein [Actinomycetota bacterium]|nr:CHC2 zinc finger domain-containing protein [Actinomycetota bacterium]